jgi:hypothetical protein
MACTVDPFIAVNLIPGGLGQVRVMGRARGCPGSMIVVQILDPATNTPITAPSVPTQIDFGTERFVVTLPLTAAGWSCGDTVIVEAWCNADPLCKRSDSEILDCCSVTLMTAQGLVPAGSLVPTVLRVTGTLFGCPGDQVVVSVPGVGQSLPQGIDPLTGGFIVTLPLPAATPPLVMCGQRLLIQAWCAQDTSCEDRRDFEIDCPGCFRAQVSATPAASCTGSPPRRDVTFNATVNVPMGQTRQFQWVFDHPQFPPLPSTSNRAPIQTVTNTTSDPNTPFSLPPETYAYPPGNYSPYLLLVPPPYECDPDRVTLSLSVQCPSPCPTGTISAVVDPTCTGNTRTVTLHATVTAPTAGASGQWRVVNAQNVVTYGKAFGVPAGQTQDHLSNPDLEQIFNLPAGTYTVSLHWTLPTGCPPVTSLLTVPPLPFHCGVSADYTPKPLPCLAANGSIPITVTASLQPANPCYTGPYDWTVTPPQGMPSTFSQTTQTHTNPHELTYTISSPGTYEIGVAVDTDSLQCKDDQNNPKYNASASVVIPVATCCPTGTLKASQISNCQWFFEADVTNPNNLALTFDWAFHDGATQQTQWPQNTTTHTYAPGSITTGNNTVTVSATGCTPLVLSRTVTHTCGACPTVAPVTANVSGTSPNASATFTTSVTPPGAASAFDWTVSTPNGTVFTKTTSAPTTTDGTADGPWTNTATGATGSLDLSASGSYTVAVVAQGGAIDPSCPPPAATGFSVPAKPTEGNPACGILRLLLVLLLGALAIAILGSICLGWPWYVPVGAAVLFLIVLVAWILLCQPTLCQVLLTLWQAAFTAMMALLYISQCLAMAGCIGWAWWIAGLVFVGFFVWWVLRCRPSDCDVLNAFFFVIVDTLGLLGLIYAGGSWLGTVFAGLSGCLLPVIPAGLGIMLAYFGLLLGFFGCTVRPR